MDIGWYKDLGNLGVKDLYFDLSFKYVHQTCGQQNLD
jgi:hypothetical protein